MAILVLGLVIFLGLHSIRIVFESGRERAIARFGEVLVANPLYGYFAHQRLVAL